MKKIKLLFTLFLLISISVQAQVPPNAFNYSAVARDAAGEPIANTAIGIQVSILQGSTSGTSLYVENHSVNTDDFGQFDLVIGGGAVQSGSMENISWNTDDFYLQIGMDANGGTNFLTMGTTQLLSVPYALHAATADSLIGGSSTQIDSASIADMGFTTNSGCGLNIGDYHAGGIIFYLEPDGCHGLVVKENDEPGTYQLFSQDIGSGFYTSDSDGYSNTKYTIQVCEFLNNISGNTISCPAFSVCDNLTYNGYSDWFLPTRKEMQFIITNLYHEGLLNNIQEAQYGEFVLGYWTCTFDESNTNGSSFFSSYFTFSGSNKMGILSLDNDEDQFLHVRAVRKF